jgi:hypothetical protein
MSLFLIPDGKNLFQTIFPFLHNFIFLQEVSKMKSNKLRTDAIKIFFFFFIILIFASQNSCSTTGSMTVAPENRIPLIKDKPQQGTWESKYAVLEYEIVKTAGTIGLIIDGRAKRKMDQIIVWVSFLDKEGRLLERETVFNSGFRTSRTRTRRMAGTIERAFEVPPETNYLAFQSKEKPYTGRHK